MNNKAAAYVGAGEPDLSKVNFDGPGIIPFAGVFWTMSLAELFSHGLPWMDSATSTALFDMAPKGTVQGLPYQVVEVLQVMAVATLNLPANRGTISRSTKFTVEFNTYLYRGDQRWGANRDELVFGMREGIRLHTGQVWLIDWPGNLKDIELKGDLTPPVASELWSKLRTSNFANGYPVETCFEGMAALGIPLNTSRMTVRCFISR